jgi:hypothetical protein
MAKIKRTIKHTKKVGAKSQKAKLMRQRRVFSSDILIFKEPISKIMPERLNRPLTIPEDQWELPVGYSINGKLVTLAEYGARPNGVATLASLSSKEKRKLIIARIKLQRSYPTRFMLGVGKVDKETAIKEIERDSPAGKFILESEQKVISMLKAEVQKAEVAHEGNLH